MDRPKLIKGADLIEAGQPTPGVTRATAFADETVWVGTVRNAPRQESGWHVHPGHDTYAYAIEGLFFVDFGPGGRERILIEPGDFALIPRGVVHREGNAGDEPNDGIAFRVGSGPVTVNLDGPED
jgi:quercetin dioxygenase-like cupin family protein